MRCLEIRKSNSATNKKYTAYREIIKEKLNTKRHWWPFKKNEMVAKQPDGKQSGTKVQRMT